MMYVWFNIGINCIYMNAIKYCSDMIMILININPGKK